MRCKDCNGRIGKREAFCPHCGAKTLDIEKTTGGKSGTWIIILLFVCLVAESALGVYVLLNHQRECEYLNGQIAELEKTLQDQTEEIDLYKTEIEIHANITKKLRKSNNDLVVENYALLRETEFYDKYVVFVSNDGTRLYHRYECSNFDSSSFWAYNTEAADDRGYSPCPKCCK